jgi:hypothetical protein
MNDERTPDGRQAALARRRMERERLIADVRREDPPDWDDTEEPSKVTIVGPAAEAFVARGSLFARAKHSLAPISERMSSPKGKLVAVMTGLVAVLGTVVKLLVDAGVLR